MPKVFISYRQKNSAELERVRAFAMRLLARGIEVVLDQFYLSENPGGPPDGWLKWSSDQALTAERVLIVGRKGWFQCFDGKQPPGTGLGAACEAGDLRHRIDTAAGVNEDIRIVLFDAVDAANVSVHIARYHCFKVDTEFEAIVKWSGGRLPTSITGVPPKTSIPNNLPRLQPFFGRERELARIREALDPENRTWGALIDGPGGMGKTSLAVRAAYDCKPGQFDRIIFVSVKDREMDDDGVRKLTGVIIPGFLEMLNEIARELGLADIQKAAEDQRIRLLLDALRSGQTLLILDNLESLEKTDRDQIFNFVKRLPQGCKALLTSRRRIGSASEELILEQLDQEAALAILNDLARHSGLLARTSESERITLYDQTAGKPLLLRWVAGQLGRGSCRTISDALDFLRACPADNDPLEFIFGDLVQEFTVQETQVLSALTYFKFPATIADIAVLAEVSEQVCQPALHSLANRSLVVPNQEEVSFALVPMVADFLRRARPEVIAETGNRLEKRAYALIVENGYENHFGFPVLDAAWPTIAPALPLYLVGPNERLQVICSALVDFLDFTGRWDEWLSLQLRSEQEAVAAGDYYDAGWRAHDAGWVNFRRRQADEALSCADRAMLHWQQSKADGHEFAAGLQLRGRVQYLKEDYAAAAATCRESLNLFRKVSSGSENTTTLLNNLGGAERHLGNWEAAEGHFREALEVASALRYARGVATSTSNLAILAYDRQDWFLAERLAREALPLCEALGRQELIARNYRCLAAALAKMGRRREALTYAEQALDIFTRLGVVNNIERTNIVLRECES